MTRKGTNKTSKSLQKRMLSSKFLKSKNFVLTPQNAADSIVVAVATAATTTTTAKRRVRQRRKKPTPGPVEQQHDVVIDWRPPNTDARTSRGNRENSRAHSNTGPQVERRPKSRRTKQQSRKDDDGVNDLCGQLVEFATLPSESFWSDRVLLLGRPRHDDDNDLAPLHHRLTLHLKRADGKFTSKTITVRISFTHHGLTLSEQDASKLYFAHDVRYSDRHMQAGSVRIEWPECRGCQYRLGSNSVFLHEPDVQDPTAVLGVKGGLPEHALLFCQGHVLPVNKHEFEDYVSPLLEQEPLWRTANRRPYLRAPACAWCGVEATVAPHTTCAASDRAERPSKSRSRRQGKRRYNETAPCQAGIVALAACQDCVKHQTSEVRMYCSRRCQRHDWKNGHKVFHQSVEDDDLHNRALSILGHDLVWKWTYAAMFVLWLLLAYVVPVAGTLGWVALIVAALVHLGVLPRVQISLLK